MAPKRRPNSAPSITARSVNSLRVSASGTNGRNSPGGAVDLHGRSLKESLPRPSQIGCVRDYAARGASGEENLGWREYGNVGPIGLLLAPDLDYIVRHNTFTGLQHLFNRRCPGDVSQAHLATRGALPPDKRPWRCDMYSRRAFFLVCVCCAYFLVRADTSTCR